MRETEGGGEPGKISGGAHPPGVVQREVPLQQQLGDGHDPVAVLQQELQHVGQGLRRVLRRVVEQHDVAGADALRDPPGNLLRAQVLPVQRIPGGSGFKGLLFPELR